MIDPFTLIAAKHANKVTSNLLKPLIEKLGDYVNQKTQLAYHRVFNSYSKYLDNAFEKHSFFTSIVFRNEQKKLEDYYLPLTLIEQPTNEQTELSKFPLELIEKVQRVLVVDNAGMGKTTLLKYLFLCCVNDGAAIPLYVELRKLSKKYSLTDFILEQLSDLKGSCQPELLFQLLESGEFVIFLDGYDEIAESDRSNVTSSLQNFIEKAPKNKYFMTSREEGGLAAFPSFQKFIIRPLQKEEAYKLLRKYADSNLAETLISKLELPENAAIHEFLTNPLLTSLLFKSFEFKQIIPLKKHIFYRQVFEALFESHDLTKEGGEFVRAKRCGLDIDRFERIMRAFGILSYHKDKVEFTKDELLSFIEKAKNLASESKISASNIFHDLTHAVPLIVQDGNYFRWSHKSIQEYFAAQYICRDSQGKQKDILLSFLEKPDISKHVNLLSLCADIDRVTFNQSILYKIAVELLSIFDNSYLGKFENISKFLINERKELVTGKEFVFTRVWLPADFNMDYPNSGAMINEALKPVEDQLKLMTSKSGSRSSVMSLSNPGIAKCNFPIAQHIDALYSRIQIPFIEEIRPAHQFEEDLIDLNINFLKIDDDPKSILNTQQSFGTMNLYIKLHGGWKFNSALANEFIASQKNEEKVRNELIEW